LDRRFSKANFQAEISKITEEPVDLYPEMNLPVAIVVTSYNGADPAEVEKVVTKPLESAVGTAGNITEIQSYSPAGNSLIVVLFNWGTDMDDAAIELREKYVQGCSAR